MADEILSQLDTSKIGKDFSDFMESQGLGDMNPSSAARFRDGVEVSPMDDILAMNGYDLDSLFRKRLPEPPPLASLGSDGTETVINTRSDERVQSAKAAVKSLGLSGEELATLSNLLSKGVNPSVGSLPAPMIQLLVNNPGISNTEDLLLQLGELYQLLDGLQPSDGRDINEIMLFFMRELKTDDSRVMLSYLRQHPLAARDALRDPVTGIKSPLGSTTTLLRAESSFDFDPIIGTIVDETLIANRAGGSRLIGGGGRDLFVIALRSNPFASTVAITDFSQESGSKVVLDTVDYEDTFRPFYRIAKNKNRLAKLSQSKTSLIFNRTSGELLLNANKKKKGYGSNGGAVATIENGAKLSKNELLLFNGDSLSYIDGAAYMQQVNTM